MYSSSIFLQSVSTPLLPWQASIYHPIRRIIVFALPAILDVNFFFFLIMHMREQQFCEINLILSHKERKMQIWRVESRILEIWSEKSDI